jgi:arylsulfatase A-like enzyme/Tfp pilus assembly protein PilF
VPRPFRYTIILALTALGTALAAVGGWRYARASAPINGPIIVISIDTLRADHLPAYGYAKVRTPAIDALAADGVVFERAYSHVPETLPAHAAMLSGRLPFDTGVRDTEAVRKDDRLLPQLLHDRGFTTGGVVSSSHLGKGTGIGRGFDFFDAEMPVGAADTPDAGVVLDGRDGTASEAIAERWLGQQSSSRVFLFLHLNEPHAPYAPPERFADYAPYDGEIAYSDEIVGHLLKYLKTHQLYDRSTIVLTSDHGEGLGDHGEQEHGLFVYEEAIHVPLIVKQAAGVGAGRRVADLVQHVDLVPTVLDLVKAPFPGNLRGRSLRTLLDGDGHLDAQPVYAESLFGRIHFGWSALKTATDGRHQYIAAPREEVYDLERDPREQQNLAGSGTRENAAARPLADLVHRLSPEPKRTAAVAADGDDDPPADPKDKAAFVERYRAALALAADNKWQSAIDALQRLVREDDGNVELWRKIASLAVRVERDDLAVDANGRIAELDPADPGAHLDAAAALLRLRRLNDAHDQAEQALRAAGSGKPAVDTEAHVMLAKIALARHDADEARQEAALAREAAPSLPMPAYVDARLLYDQGQYEDALPLFEQASLAVKQAHAAPVLPLHYYLAETLVHLDRRDEAEVEYGEALRDFPRDARARGGLAALYQSSGRSDEASQTIAQMLQVSPTPESYALAARLWKAFGNARQADAVRAESRRAFPETRQLAKH